MENRSYTREDLQALFGTKSKQQSENCNNNVMFDFRFSGGNNSEENNDVTEVFESSFIKKQKVEEQKYDFQNIFLFGGSFNPIETQDQWKKGGNFFQKQPLRSDGRTEPIEGWDKQGTNAPYGNKWMEMYRERLDAYMKNTYFDFATSLTQKIKEHGIQHFSSSEFTQTYQDKENEIKRILFKHKLSTLDIRDLTSQLNAITKTKEEHSTLLKNAKSDAISISNFITKYSKISKEYDRFRIWYFGVYKVLSELLKTDVSSDSGKYLGNLDSKLGEISENDTTTQFLLKELLSHFGYYDVVEFKKNKPISKKDLYNYFNEYLSKMLRLPLQQTGNIGDIARLIKSPIINSFGIREMFNTMREFYSLFRDMFKFLSDINILRYTRFMSDIEDSYRVFKPSIDNFEEQLKSEGRDKVFYGKVSMDEFIQYQEKLEKLYFDFRVNKATDSVKIGSAGKPYYTGILENHIENDEVEQNFSVKSELYKRVDYIELLLEKTYDYLQSKLTGRNNFADELSKLEKVIIGRINDLQTGNITPSQLELSRSYVLDFDTAMNILNTGVVNLTSVMGHIRSAHQELIIRVPRLKNNDIKWFLTEPKILDLFADLVVQQIRRADIQFGSRFNHAGAMGVLMKETAGFLGVIEKMFKTV